MGSSGNQDGILVAHIGLRRRPYQTLTGIERQGSVLQEVDALLSLLGLSQRVQKSNRGTRTLLFQGFDGRSTGRTVPDDHKVVALDRRGGRRGCYWRGERFQPRHVCGCAKRDKLVPRAGLPERLQLGPNGWRIVEAARLAWLGYGTSSVVA
jgi:hypothetical protein